jgi:hypothetical protein
MLNFHVIYVVLNPTHKGRLRGHCSGDDGPKVYIIHLGGFDGN